MKIFKKIYKNSDVYFCHKNNHMAETWMEKNTIVQMQSIGGHTIIEYFEEKHKDLSKEEKANAQKVKQKIGFK